jgi:uncharacterized protein YjbJ (UPF0337 family)
MLVSSGLGYPGWLEAETALERLSKERRKRKQMKPSSKDEIKGKLHEMKGKAKEKIGQATNSPNLTAEGQNEELAGKVQKKVGQVEEVFEK